MTTNLFSHSIGRPYILIFWVDHILCEGIIAASEFGLPVSHFSFNSLDTKYLIQTKVSSGYLEGIRLNNCCACCWGCHLGIKRKSHAITFRLYLVEICIYYFFTFLTGRLLSLLQNLVGHYPVTVIPDSI